MFTHQKPGRVRSVRLAMKNGPRWMLLTAALFTACIINNVGLASNQATQPPREPSPPRPNIILILADDMGFSDLGSYGSTINTPNLDKLAAEGMRFTQFYNAARCCPSRASLLTGLYPHQAGIGHMIGRGAAGYPGTLSRNAVTLAEALQPSGYSTYMTGKWHVTPQGAAAVAQSGPVARGFEHFYGIIDSIRSYYNPPTLTENAQALPATQGDYHFTDATTDHAVKSITGQKADRPYFLYVAYAAPHFPLHAREADVAKYRGKFKAGWDALRDQRYRRLVELTLIDPTWPRPPRDPQEIPFADVNPAYIDWFDERMAVYAAMIEQMDRGVGKILEAVRARADRDNTLVLFLSDNGGCAEELLPRGNAAGNFPRQTRDGRPVRVGNVPGTMPGPEDTYASVGLEWAGLSNTPFRRYKSFLHEGGIATPLIVWWPGRVRRGITHEIGHVVDLMPTFLDAARATYPAEYQGRRIIPVEGRSLMPVLQGGTRPTAIYGWEHEGNRALREGDWKIVTRGPGAWELYDMKADRLETKDLAREMPEKLAAMTALYQAYAKRVGVLPWRGNQTPIGFPDSVDRYRKR